MEEELTARLKAHTSTAHAQAEALLYSEQLFKGTITLAQYAHLLQVHHQFHVAMDAAIQEHEELAAIAPTQRSKSEVLKRDLAALGEAVLPADDRILFNFSLPQLIGALYVSEGSMLGGAVIARTVSRIEGLRTGGCTNFFTLYGSDLGRMWMAFCGRLNARPHTEWPAILDGAQRAFGLYSQLFHSTTTAKVHG